MSNGVSTVEYSHWLSMEVTSDRDVLSLTSLLDVMQLRNRVWAKSSGLDQTVNVLLQDLY